MLSVTVGAIATLIGVLLGGAIRAREASHSRKMEAEALLSALVAEVEAITRLIHHRQFIPALLNTQAKARVQIQAGHASEEAEFLTISLKQNYFSTYEASLEKIGWLDPYWADRITRFYKFLKAVTENYQPSSPFQNGVTAEAADEVVTNDLKLLHTVVLLGNHISGESRKIEPPKGVLNPFLVAPDGQPPLPISQPQLANVDAGGN